MRILVRHPVPVRWTPPRATASRLTASAAMTPVEVPELPSGTIGASGRRYVLPDGTEHDVLLHAGRCWRPVHPAMVGVMSDPRRLASVEEFARHLGGDARGGPGVVEPLTPLRVGLRAGRDATARGEDLPESILSRAHRDNTEAARAALRTWMATRFAIQDGVVYAQAPLPRLAPHSGIPGLIDLAQPDGLALGPCFEPERFGKLGAYLFGFGGYRGDWRARVARLEGRLDELPYPGDDLRTFLQDGPGAFLRQVQGFLSRARAVGTDASWLAEHVARIEPFAELGAVGAIPPEDLPVCAAAVEAALDAMAARSPEIAPTTQIRMLAAYLNVVAIPSLVPETVPEADADALAGLGRRS